MYNIVRLINKSGRTAMIMLEEILDVFFNVLAHRIGVRILEALSGGRFKANGVSLGAGRWWSDARRCSHRL